MGIERFSVELARPLDTAAGTIDSRTGFLVRTDGGLGEATPLPGWTESLDECRAALERGTPDDSTPAARHGVSLARTDAAARESGERLCDTLAADAGFADPAADAVPVNATVGDGSVAETADAVRTAVEEGYDCVKVKVGARSPETDEERLRAARDAAGDAAELRADANGAWDAATAERMLDVAAELDFSYVEQPLPAERASDHAALRGRGVGVALDESLSTTSVSAVLDADAADVLVCKPMSLGGPDRTLAAVRRAREAGVECVVTTTIDAVVARLGAVHVAAAVPDVPACGLATGSMLASDLAPDPAPVSEGRIEVPEGPGLGDGLEQLYRP
ncbi:mandelate racemase/muconate lactonizing enzyme family protein [Halopelagius longus]|uniref:o-succinylbenzoate synthase n=1 Tax=Halopelagius longus TaxID=1236180 RepID=A0A1H1AT30_9EURY|nr:o-succinylbenzoate synthase [Halopelagius longus]RDI70508.1 o-succinylbenzoate synthase [Halopelagius longus]SDQ42855.1 L-alanine-DL-glutamate epimerase [Halopelagius longus]